MKKNNSTTDSILRPLKAQVARNFPLGIEPSDVQKIELSISDAALEDHLANLGPRLLCLCPTPEIDHGTGFEIPGRNAYAVKVGVYMTQLHWPGATHYSLLIVPDTDSDYVLPPEYVHMLEAKTLVSFEVTAGL